MIVSHAGMINPRGPLEEPALQRPRGAAGAEGRVRLRRELLQRRCTKFCRPRDDFFGHYTCDQYGNKACLDGWMGKECKEGEPAGRGAGGALGFPAEAGGKPGHR